MGLYRNTIRYSKKWMKVKSKGNRRAGFFKVHNSFKSALIVFLFFIPRENLVQEAADVTVIERDVVRSANEFDNGPGGPKFVRQRVWPQIVTTF
jgi:hypothetical protein